MTDQYRHIPVLLAEVLEYARTAPHHVFVDATLGGAGHAIRLAQGLSSHGILIGIDQDAMALAAAGARLESQHFITPPRIELLCGNFGNLDGLLMQAEVPGVDGFLFDLGVSSPQIDFSSRGFSFKEDAPLDMRMSPGNQTTTAAELVNTLTAAELARVIRSNSDEKWANRIAEFIVEARQRTPIERSGHLVDIIKAAIPASARREGGHPAKRTFQALRIEVNGELDALRRGLEAAIRWANSGARIMAISYHSLEDRIVKETFARFAQTCTCPPDLPVCACGTRAALKVITRKPVVPTADEVSANPRARSAKLRVAEKI